MQAGYTPSPTLGPSCNQCLLDTDISSKSRADSSQKLLLFEGLFHLCQNFHQAPYLSAVKSSFLKFSQSRLLLLATVTRCNTSYFPVTCGHGGDGTEQMCTSQGTALSERAERATGTVCVVKSPPYMDLSSQMLSALEKPSGRHPWELLYQASYRQAELRSTFKCILFHTKARFTLQTVPPNC